MPCWKKLQDVQRISAGHRHRGVDRSGLSHLTSRASSNNLMCMHAKHTLIPPPNSKQHGFVINA